MDEARRRSHQPPTPSADRQHGIALELLLRGDGVAIAINALVHPHQQHDRRDPLVERLGCDQPGNLYFAHSWTHSAGSVFEGLTSMVAHPAIAFDFLRSKLEAQARY